MVVISLISAKGGTGKTTVTANLATVLVSEFGKKVLVIDGNITTPNLAIQLGYLLPPKKTLIEVLNNTVPISDAICKLSTGVNLLPSSLSMYISYPDPENLAEKISEIRNEYDYILIDGAAGIGREVISVVRASDTVMLVMNPNMTSIVSGIKAIKVVKACEKPIIGIILNKVRKKKYEILPNRVEEICENDVISCIPFDEKMEESIANEKPLVLYDKNSKASRALRKLGSKITEENLVIKKSLLEKIKDLFIPSD